MSARKGSAYYDPSTRKFTDLFRQRLVGAASGGYDSGDPLGNAMQAGNQYLRGGVPGMLTSMGYQAPGWVNTVGRFVNNPDLNAAMGATVPMARPMPLPAATPGTLSDADHDIESRFAQQLRNNPAQAMVQYGALEDTAGGKVLNTDLARELSADYRADRTKSAAVHEPASDFIKRLYAQKLAQPPGPGELPEVTFTAGGTGAGKTSALKGMQSALDQSQVIYDTNMNGYSSANGKMQQALAAGKNVNVFYVYRDPIDALVNGALPRADRMEKTLGSGRTVPLSEHVATHLGAYDTVNRLAAEYAGDDRVRIVAIDNSHGPGGAKAVPLETLPNPHQGGLNERLQQALAAARATGRISQAIYEGFAGGARQQVNGRVGQQLEPQRPAGQPAPQGQVLDFPRPGGYALGDGGGLHTIALGRQSNQFRRQR